MFIQFIWVHALLIRQSGDIEMNPGPKPNPCHSFSICHWNLNSLAAHNYLKVSLLRAYVAIKKFDVVYLSETYLDSSYLSDNNNFYLPGYNLVRADHPSNAKNGGVCISFKNSLPLKFFFFFSIWVFFHEHSRFVTQDNSFEGQYLHHIETSELTCSVNKLPGFYATRKLSLMGSC